MTVEQGLTAAGISKGYGQTLALDTVTVSLMPGKITGLIGHNGAGKSTLLRSLSGAERPDSGALVLNGVAQSFDSPADAKAAGIACVYQELSLVDELTVAQNVFLGDELKRGFVLSRREMERITAELLERYGISAHPSDPVERLPVAARQMVEVAAAIHRDAKFLLLDEPTTALELDQIYSLLAVIRTLADESDLAVLLVDHKLDEVFAVADHIVGLANGRVVLDGPVSEVDRAAVVRAIVGESESASNVVLDHSELDTGNESEAFASVEAALHTRPEGPVRLSVQAVSGPGLGEVNLDVRRGEVLGIYGLVGSGRSRFLRTLMGAAPMSSGEILLDGERYTPRSPGHAIETGIGYLSEERKRDGFIPQMSSTRNVSLPVLSRFTRFGFVDRAKANAAARKALQAVAVRGDIERPITDLSGGNQQKALFGRVRMQMPRILLLDEPTKGVDIGAKAEIHALIRSLAEDSGAAVIVVSSEEEELLSVADSVCVFASGSCDGTILNVQDADAVELRTMAWDDANNVA